MDAAPLHQREAILQRLALTRVAAVLNEVIVWLKTVKLLPPVHARLLEREIYVANYRPHRLHLLMLRSALKTPNVLVLPILRVHYFVKNLKETILQ